MTSILCHQRPLISPALRALASSRYIQIKTSSFQKQTKQEDSCYNILGVSSDCDDLELRNAFISKAKEYHPDSGNNTADASKFANVEQAFRFICQQRQKKEKTELEEEMEEIILEIKHTAPQHRQYLSFEGKGHGSPAQREKQYRQYQFGRAFENVHEYRTQKVAAKYEDALVLQDKRAARRARMKNTLHRVAEDLIAEMMQRGEFDKIQGQGQPLEYKEHNPMVDSMTHNLNKILIQNGYAPEWVMMDRDIRHLIEVGRKNLMKGRIKAGPEPLGPGAKREWDYYVMEFKSTVEDVNKKIADFNILVPSMRQQKMTYNFNKEIKKVLTQYREMSKNGELEKLLNENLPDNKDKTSQQQKDTPLKNIWQQFKTVFSSSRQ